MASFETSTLLDDLCNQVQAASARAAELQKLSAEQLNRQPGPDRWSIAQVVEHLNSYHRYYLPAMKKALQKAERYPAPKTFRSGWLGNYFTRLMQPGADGTIANKMQAPKGYRPGDALQAHKVLEEFLAHQHELLLQLKAARTADIGKARVPISISPFIRLKLGDTIRFNIAHIQRHFVQIEKTFAVIVVRSAATTQQ